MPHNPAAPRLGATLVTILAAGLGLVVHDASAKQRALLIGINDYLANDAGQTATGGWVPQDLNGALNDVALMRSVLERRYGFPSESITILENEAATREAMLENLARIIADSGPGDTVYIHFSGHGSQVEDRNGDETDGLDESILPYDARTGDVPDITDDELGALLAGLKTDRAWIVLDSCHSGTATRGAGQVLTRSVALDPRGDLYEAQPGPGAGSLEAPYVLMTGAAEYQSALDGPIDEGRHYGLFTLSMGRVMGQADAAIPARDLHHRVREEMARIGGQFGLYAIPEAQLEGPEDRLSAPVLQPVSGSTGVAVSGSGDEVRLEGAGRLAAMVGSVWSVVSGDGDPAASATLVVDRVDGDDAIARFEGRGEAVASVSMAIPVVPARPADTVTVHLDRMSETDRQALRSALPVGAPVRIVGDGAFAAFVVDRSDHEFRMYSAGGLQAVAAWPADDPVAAASGLARLAERSVRLNELLALNNPVSSLAVSVTVDPRDASGLARSIPVAGAGDVGRYSVRQPGAERHAGNSLVLRVEVSEDAWLTVVDVDAQGNVAQLFPNPVSDRNGFYPDGLVPGGRPVYLPDGLGANRAGFHWDIVPPAGVDTIRVFAARDLRTAETLRALVREVGGVAAVRGGPETDLRRSLYLESPAFATRGVATVVSEPGPPDWSAASVTFIVEP